jgi:hypothetical protein
MPDNPPDYDAEILQLIRALGVTGFDLIKALTKIECIVADIAQMQEKGPVHPPRYDPPPSASEER